MALAFCLIAALIFGGTWTAKNIGLANITSTVQLAKMAQISGKYLVLFENNNELRPSGGFLGSFAEINLNKGKISDIYFDTNIYKRDNAFAKDHQIAPPKSFQILYGAPYWTMRDSNWAADFRTSAQQVAWFYQQEGGNEVDGVIALDTTFFTNILQLTGPIYLEKYKMEINADNFLKEVQYEVEKGYWEEDTTKTMSEPKTILKDLMGEILPKMQELPKTKILKLVLETLKQKHLMFYFNDPAMEDVALRENWGGVVMQTQGDYLYVVNSTINVGDDPKVNNGGGKTNLSVAEKINYKVVKNQLGDLLVTLSILRTHAGSWDWPDGQNNNYARILVPKDSQLQSANLDGQDVSKDIYTTVEAGKTSFGIWNKTQPQTSKLLTLTYQLPMSAASNYSLLVQKQPGALSSQLQVIYENKVLYDGLLDHDISVNLD